MQERGKIKEKEFMKKLQQMMEEEEKLRMPTTQGLPWTTAEPEVTNMDFRLGFTHLHDFFQDNYMKYYALT